MAVFIPFDESVNAVVNGVVPIGVVCKCVEVGFAHSVRFNIRLVDYVKSVFFAHLEETRVVRIVRGTNGIDVMLLHHFEVEHHILNRANVAGKRVRVVAVYALNFNHSVIEFECAVDNLALTECDGFGNILAHSVDEQGIKFGTFGIP